MENISLSLFLLYFSHINATLFQKYIKKYILKDKQAWKIGSHWNALNALKLVLYLRYIVLLLSSGSIMNNWQYLVSYSVKIIIHK